MPGPLSDPGPIEPRPIPVQLPVRRRYNPADWYWIVGGDETQVYSSKRSAFFPVDDAEYQAWLLPQGNETVAPLPTRIASQAELDEVLDNAMVSPKMKAFYSDVDRQALVDMIAGATPDQIKTYITNNVTDLASARAMLTKIVLLVAMTLRD